MSSLGRVLAVAVLALTVAIALPSMAADAQPARMTDTVQHSAWDVPWKGRPRLWVVETGVRPNRLVGFDPKSQRFFGHTDLGENAVNAVRHMVYDPATRSLWYGSDQGQLGRAVVPRLLPVLQD